MSDEKKNGLLSALFGSKKKGGCCDMRIVEEAETQGCGCEAEQTEGGKVLSVNEAERMIRGTDGGQCCSDGGCCCG